VKAGQVGGMPVVEPDADDAELLLVSLDRYFIAACERDVALGRDRMVQHCMRDRVVRAFVRHVKGGDLFLIHGPSVRGLREVIIDSVESELRLALDSDLVVDHVSGELRSINQDDLLSIFSTHFRASTEKVDVVISTPFRACAPSRLPAKPRTFS
jgi:hypothetical protein